MRLFIAALLIVMALPAAADDPNARAEREARAWLRPCRESDRQRQQLCLINQREFILAYVYAKAGDTSAMINIASRLSPRRDAGENPDQWLGMPKNLVESCAWEAARIQSMSGDTSAYKNILGRHCVSLTPNQLTLADERVEQLLEELRHAQARVPALGWEPRVAGLSPSPKIDPRCLDSTVCAPDDDDCPPFVPPKGCPARP